MYPNTTRASARAMRVRFREASRAGMFVTDFPASSPNTSSIHRNSQDFPPRTWDRSSSGDRPLSLPNGARYLEPPLARQSRQLNENRLIKSRHSIPLSLEAILSAAALLAAARARANTRQH